MAVGALELVFARVVVLAEEVVVVVVFKIEVFVDVFLQRFQILVDGVDLVAVVGDRQGEVVQNIRHGGDNFALFRGLVKVKPFHQALQVSNFFSDGHSLQSPLPKKSH